MSNKVHWGRVYHNGKNVILLPINETTLVGDKDKKEYITVVNLANSARKTMLKEKFLSEFKLAETLSVT